MSSFNSTLLPRQGAHPVSTNTIHLAGPFRRYDACILHLFYTLPPLLFVDTHELAQRHTSYTFQHWGTRDLERPVHALPDAVSELLLSVILDSVADDADIVLDVEVPMHLRYAAPQSLSSSVFDEHLEEERRKTRTKPYTHLTVPWPAVFLRCPAPLASVTSSPPSLPSHILSALSAPETATAQGEVLITIPPLRRGLSDGSDVPHHTLVVPVGNLQDLAVVEPLTALTIMLCFFWLARVSWRVAKRIPTTNHGKNE